MGRHSGEKGDVCLFRKQEERKSMKDGVAWNKFLNALHELKWLQQE